MRVTPSLTPQTTRPTRAVAGTSRVGRVMVVLLLAVLAVLAMGRTEASAQNGEVRLTGDNANNFFIIEAQDTSTLRFCTDLIGCFTRARGEFNRIVIDGFDGDDGVFISHKAGIVSVPNQSLSITVVGGVGNDEVRFCTLGTCSEFMTTDVSYLPETDEVRVVQCLGRTQATGRCIDLPGQAPVPTLKVNISGSDVITDLTRGPLSVTGTPAGETISVREGVQVTNPQGTSPARAGEVLVDNAATIRFLNKDNLVLDAGPGVDVVQVATQAGLTPLPTTCARDGATGVAALCVIGGDEAGDRLSLAAGSASEQVVLTTRPPGVSRLSGLQVPPAMDVTGFEVIDVPQQPDEGDSFTLLGTGAMERLAVQATAPDRLAVSGTYATETGVPSPVPAVSLTGDGSGPLRLTLDGAADPDELTVTTGATSDAITLRPSTSSPACTATAGACLELSSDGRPHTVLTALAIEAIAASTGDGTDTLTYGGDTAAEVVWRSGAGEDRLSFTSSGRPVKVDYAAGTVREVGGSGGLAVEEVEVLGVDVKDRNLTVAGTAGEDVFTYTPTSPTAATITRGTDARRVETTSVKGTMEIDPAGGGDTVLVRGTSASESITTFRGLTAVTQVGALLPLRTTAATEELHVDGGAGDDRFILSGSGGPSAISVIGGAHRDGDRLSFAASEAPTSIRFDAAPASGSLAAGGAPVTFEGLEHVDAEGDGTDSFTVFGSDAVDTLVQTGGSVTAGRGTTVGFAGYDTLSLDGLQGDDEFVVAPRALPAGTSAVSVAGREGSDTVLVQGTSLRETIVYHPDGADSGRVEMSLAPTVGLTGTEQVEVDGFTSPPSGDTLLVRSPDIAGTVQVAPGAAVDAGTITLRDAPGPVTAFAPLHFARLGRGGVTIDGGDIGGTPTDRVSLVGEPDADAFVVATDGGGGSTTALDARVPVATTRVHTVGLDGRDGADTFSLPAAHGVTGAVGSAFQVDGGGSAGDGDTATVAGVAGPVAVDLEQQTVANNGHRPLRLIGLDRVVLDAGVQPVDVLGGAGPDQMVVEPISVDSARVRRDGPGATIDISRAAGLTIDPVGGADAVTVTGRTSPDAISVSRDTVSTVVIDGLLGVRIGETAEAITVQGRQGRDEMTVTGSGGPGSLLLDGGEPALDGDVVRVIAAEAEVALGVPATSGRLRTPGGEVLIAGMDVIDQAGDGTGTLTVLGSDAPDTMTIGDPGVPAIRVNAGPAITYAGYPTLSLAGRGGTDQTTVTYDNLGEVSRVSLLGGSGADDLLTVVDTLGSQRTFEVRPSDADLATLSASGIPTLIDIAAGQLVTINGRDGDDEVRVVSPTGAQQVTVERGSAADTGVVRVGSLLPIGFTAIGRDGTITINDPGAPAEDLIVVAGTPAADRFGIDGASRRVAFDGFVDMVANGASSVRVRGFDGEDDVTATGPLTWALVVEGGGPGNGDRLELHAPIDPAVVDLGAGSVAGYGAPVSFSEISDLQTSHAYGNLTVIGTARDDAMCYFPQSPRDGLLHVVGAPGGGLETDTCLGDARALDLLHTFIDVGSLLLDPAGGVDQVIANGSVGPDAIAVDNGPDMVIVTVDTDPFTTAGVRLPMWITTPTTEQLVVATDNGEDLVDVGIREAAVPAITVHGEAPETSYADRLTVRDLTGGADISSSNGIVEVFYKDYSGIRATILHTGIEKVATVRRSRSAGEIPQPIQPFNAPRYDGTAPPPDPGTGSDWEPAGEDPGPDPDPDPDPNPDPDPDPEPEPDPLPVPLPIDIIPPLCLGDVICTSPTG